jgi:hypothetical protein
MVYDNYVTFPIRQVMPEMMAHVMDSFSSPLIANTFCSAGKAILDSNYIALPRFRVVWRRKHQHLFVNAISDYTAHNVHHTRGSAAAHTLITFSWKC